MLQKQSSFRRYIRTPFGPGNLTMPRTPQARPWQQTEQSLEHQPVPSEQQCPPPAHRQTLWAMMSQGRGQPGSLSLGRAQHNSDIIRPLRNFSSSRETHQNQLIILIIIDKKRTATLNPKLHYFQNLKTPTMKPLHTHPLESQQDLKPFLKMRVHSF